MSVRAAILMVLAFLPLGCATMPPPPDTIPPHSVGLGKPCRNDVDCVQTDPKIPTICIDFVPPGNPNNPPHLGKCVLQTGGDR